MNVMVKTGSAVLSVLKKYSPEILLGTGIITGGTGLVLACKQTLKLNDTLEEETNILDKIDAAVADGTDGYSEEDAKKDKKECYLKMAKKCAKLYALPFALEVAALASFSGCYAVLNHDKKELTTLVASYANTLATYRERVREKYGKEADEELILGKKVVTTNPDTGEVTEEYPESLVADQLILFDRSCCNWVNNAEYNKTFLFQIQSMLNDKLHTQGYLTVNDVREALGAPYISNYKAAIEANINGWWEGSTVDFGLTRDDPAVKAFMNGEVKEVWLKLNVDGPLKNAVKL